MTNGEARTSNVSLLAEWEREQWKSQIVISNPAAKMRRRFELRHSSFFPGSPGFVHSTFVISPAAPMPTASSTVPSPILTPELLVQLERLELISRKIFRGRMKGERRSKRKGQSVEFADFRSYVPGDDLRFIDWNTYARLDRLFLKMFLEEEDLHFYALIDASASMDFGTPTKLHYAKQLAAALGFIGLTRADRVRIETLGQSARQPGPVLRGRQSLRRMIECLESIAPGEKISLAEGVKNFCIRNSGKGILVLITDLMDKQGYESALRYLLAQQMDVYVIQTLSVEEIEPEIAGDLRLVDSEDGDEAEITVSAPLMARYKRHGRSVHRHRPDLLQSPRHVVSPGPQRCAGRSIGAKLSAPPRAGAVRAIERGQIGSKPDLLRLAADSISASL